MGSEELLWIKEIQREFKGRFGKHLHIDWNLQKELEAPRTKEGRRSYPPEIGDSFKKLSCTPEQYFHQCCAIFGVHPDVILNRTNGKVPKGSLERRVLLKFAVDSYRQGWNITTCSKIVGKSVALMRHYAYVIYPLEKHTVETFETV